MTNSTNHAVFVTKAPTTTPKLRPRTMAPFVNHHAKPVYDGAMRDDDDGPSPPPTMEEGKNITEWVKHIRGNTQEAFGHCVSKGPEILLIWLILGILIGCIITKCCCRNGRTGDYQRISKVQD